MVFVATLHAQPKLIQHVRAMRICKGSSRFIELLQSCLAPRVTFARQLWWSPHSSLPGIEAHLSHGKIAAIQTPLKGYGLELRLGPFLDGPTKGSFVYGLLDSSPETCPRYTQSTQMPRSCRTPAAASSASCCSVESSTRLAILLQQRCRLPSSSLGAKCYSKQRP